MKMMFAYLLAKTDQFHEERISMYSRHFLDYIFHGQYLRKLITVISSLCNLCIGKIMPLIRALYLKYVTIQSQELSVSVVKLASIRSCFTRCPWDLIDVLKSLSHK